MANPMFNILVDLINGGLNDSGAAMQIADNELKIAQNVRFLESGGFFTRPGYINAEQSTGENKVWDGVYAMDDDSLVFAVTNGKIFHNGSGSMQLIYSGLTPNKSWFMKEYNGDVYMINTTDGFKRIGLTTIQTPLTAAVSTTVTVASGQGWRFGTSGTININGDDITYTARVNDVLTITAATVTSNHIVGEYITEFSSPPDTPKGVALAFFGEKCMVVGVPGESGNNYTDSTLFYSKTALADTPQRIYEFDPAKSRELIGKGGTLTAIISTRDNAFVFKKKSIEYIYTIDATSGAPLHKEVSSIYGVPGPDCVCQMGNVVVFFTGKSLKTLGLQSEMVTTFTINQFFDKKLERTLQNLDDDQNDARLVFDKNRQLLKLWANYNNQRLCFVFKVPTPTAVNRRFSGAWSIDVGKNADRAVFWKNDIYFSATDKLFRDEFGLDDDGSPIQMVVESKEFTAGNFIEPDEWRKLVFVGAMTEDSSFDLTIFVDGFAVVTSTVNASDLITPTGGFPIGSSTIGYNVVGGGGSSLATVYPFDFPFEKAFIAVGSRCWWRIETSGTYSAIQIDQFSLIGERFSDEPLTDDR